MFDFCWKFTLAHEGGLDDDPDDPGGVTKYGVDMRMLKDMEKRTSDRAELKALGVKLPICRESVVSLTRAQAAAIYRYAVWERLGLSRFSVPVACVLFDAGVNNGVSASVKFLQRAHNDLRPSSPLVVDGRLGPKTRAAIFADNPQRLAGLALDRRAYWFRSHVKVKPKSKKYLKGWLNRVSDLRKYLGL